jgi:lysophospholipase L1-like esterase
LGLLLVLTTTSSAFAAVSGSQVSPPESVNLSAEGSADWVHWGRSTASSIDRKASGGSQISNITVIGSQPKRRFSGARVSYSWNDGTPASSIGATATGLYFRGVGNGYQFTVPADTTARTLRIYVNVWRARGRIEASLSDSSAPTYVAFIENLSDITTRLITLDYSAATSGQTLTFRFVAESVASTSGNVTVQSATLTGTGGGNGGGAYSKLVTFGDSLSDTGNVYALSNGQDPRSPPYYQGRYSDGPDWSEQVASYLSIPLVTKAHGGAFTGTSSTDGLYPGLLTQVQQYLQSNGNVVDPAALYGIWVGSNDLLALQSAGTTAQTAISDSISNITTAMQQLAGSGANRFLILNLPDLGLIPRARSGQSNLPAADLTRLSDDFNAALRSAVGGTIKFVDVASAHRQVTNSPGAVGLSNVTQSCLAQACQNPSSFLFYDDLHPTNAGHSILKDEVLDIID